MNASAVEVVSLATLSASSMRDVIFGVSEEQEPYLPATTESTESP